MTPQEEKNYTGKKNKNHKSKTSETIKPEKDVLREPGQISFKDAMKKAMVPLKSKKLKL